MLTTFKKFPEFIDSDPRVKRPEGYVISEELLLARYSTLLPNQLIANCSVLDIGCCVASAGAWVLDNGAHKYVGIEVNSDLADESKKNLQKYFSNSTWEILNTSFENFIQNNTEKFDIVIASGIIYSLTQYQKFVVDLSEITNLAVVVESRTPPILRQLISSGDLSLFPIVEYKNNHPVFFSKDKNVEISSALPSLGVLEILFGEVGFSFNRTSYSDLKKTHPHYKNEQRFGAIFKKSGVYKQRSVNDAYKNIDSLKTIPWEYENTTTQTTIPAVWEFNESIANSFVDHARKHIPDYDKVINLSIKVCKTLLTDRLEDKIIDVGCATGETINRLWANGLCNLIGVDNSQAMLARCQNKHAFYILSDQFPKENGPYKSVLCNWTLHFIRDKKTYLADIFNSLTTDGFLILTDKTANEDIDLELYHDFKREKGVSEEEIKQKTNSLKDVMFINDINWYIDTLTDLGFTKVSVINAAPCFTTFLAKK